MLKVIMYKPTIYKEVIATLNKKETDNNYNNVKLIQHVNTQNGRSNLTFYTGGSETDFSTMSCIIRIISGRSCIPRM